jgi:hypothetical protein
VSIQVAVLKILSSHRSGRATLASLNRDIAVLSASGAEWSARIRRLASRVATIDIFGSGYVLRDDEGWEITAAGRDFLQSLEAVTQDNLLSMPERSASSAAKEPAQGELIVVGHRFKNRVNRHVVAARLTRAYQGEANAGSPHAPKRIAGDLDPA